MKHAPFAFGGGKKETGWFEWDRRVAESETVFLATLVLYVILYINPT